jgi:hypothetical protein
MKIKANPEIRELLLKRIESGKRNTQTTLLSRFANVITFKIPVYQPGFAIAVLIFLFAFLHDKTPETIRYLSRVDTVYLEKESASINSLPETNLSQKTNTTKGNSINHIVKNNGSLKSPVNTESQQSTNNQNVYQKIRLVKKLPAGSSALNDSALLKFLVSAN